MNFGLVGWGIASGNGGMNHDIALLASWVTHWLIPDHPKLPNHEPYIERQATTKVMQCRLTGDENVYNKFLDQVDAILYVEHPCLKDDYDIVSEAKKKGKFVLGIPMWEWWPERKSWALQTDALWAVTNFTCRYLNSLSDVLYVHGWQHNWRNKVFGNRWGVNLTDFPFRQRTKANKFVFINGNGGYKLRKGSDVVFEAFSMPGAPPLVVYTQQTEIMAKNLPPAATVINENFSDRKDVYDEGDVFLFPSYWEGLCHGVYEGQACGGVVITTDHPPMNECGTPFLVPVHHLLQEDLSGKKIVKACPSSTGVYELCTGLFNSNIEAQSISGSNNIRGSLDLNDTLVNIYADVCKIVDN